MMCWLGKLFGQSGIERPSPSNIVKEENITVDGNKIIISLENLAIPLTKTPKVWIPMIPDTNSMDGVFDAGNNNMLISGTCPEDQQLLVSALVVGDVAVYKTETMYAIHRIIEMGEDKEGRYFHFKGDNNSGKDPDKVRDNQIQWVSIGVIY